jgi:hypothetical protein
MSILASLCNIKSEYRSGLILLDEDLDSYQYIELPESVPRAGITGIAITKGELVIASQGGCISVLDRDTFSLLYSHIPKIISNVHSILMHDGVLYLVATNLNAIAAWKMDRKGVTDKRIYWRKKDAYGWDIDHLNSICRYQGLMLVSGFGERDSSLWSSARKGFILDTGSGEVIYEGLCQPHSLTSCGDSLLLCESAKARVVDPVRGKSATLDGYVRGLCRGGKGLYAAGSKGRTISRSTGLMVTNPDEEGDPSGRSAIYLLDWDSFEVVKSIDLGNLEIYDLVLIGEEADHWRKLGQA